MDNKIEVCITKDFELWLRNDTDSDIQLKCGELFGFGVGSCQQLPTGLLIAPTNLKTLYVIRFEYVNIAFEMQKVKFASQQAWPKAKPTKPSHGL